MVRAHRVVAALVLASACVDESPTNDDAAFADEIVAFTPSAGTHFGHDALPDIVLGPPGGVFDVVSLGCEGSIVLGFDAPGIVDGPGADLIVFENPFDETFPEPGEVSVSDDGQRWWVFVCDPITLVGCAGRSPTLALPGSGIDPRDPELAGGDAFDLAELVDGPTQVSFVRIEDRSRAHWDALGGIGYCDPGSGGAGGFDLDAIAVVH